MPGLTLREEFRGKRLKETAIELSNDSITGATQIAAINALMSVHVPGWRRWEVARCCNAN